MLAQNDYRSRLGLDFEPSTYQAAIFEWITTGRAVVRGRTLTPWSVVVDSVAGSGKTTTSVHAIRLFSRGDVLACAFNREIADVLEARLEGTGATVKTAHGHGYAAVRWYCFSRNGLDQTVKVEVDKSERKYADMFAAAASALADRIANGQLATLCGVELTDEQVLALLQDDAADTHPENVADALAPIDEETIRERVAANWPASECDDLCRFARLHLLDFDADAFVEDLDYLSRHHDVDVSAELWPLVVIAVRNALRRGCAHPESGTWVIDYTDMLWLPNALGLRPKQYDLVVVDECQDISTAARRLLINSVRRGGRMMWIGDARQSINGFAGADSESFDAIIRETNAVVLPLSVCYRCPTLHLERAREWRPDIEARPGAPAGVIRTLERSDYVDEAKPGDLVICRRTAPMLDMCFELIAAGVSASVRGRADISKGLVKLIKRASKGLRGAAWGEHFFDRLADVERHEADKIRKRARDDASAAASIEALGDRIECVRVIVRSSGAQSLDDATAAIERIFADRDAAVTLSTVHRAKGLEADRVVILEHDRLISAAARQPWQYEQEENLCYVAWTRAKREIIEIPAPKKERAA